MTRVTSDALAGRLVPRALSFAGLLEYAEKTATDLGIVPTPAQANDFHWQIIRVFEVLVDDSEEIQSKKATGWEMVMGYKCGIKSLKAVEVIFFQNLFKRVIPDSGFYLSNAYMLFN